MIAWGVSAPDSAGLVAEAAGGLVVVAESVRHDGCGEFEELLPDGGAAGRGDRDSDLVQERGQVVGAERLAGPAAREELAGCRVGRGVFAAVRDVLQQQGCDWCGNGRGRLAEP